MAKFDTYREAFPNARLSRKPNGVLDVALHTDGGKLVFNGHTHEQFAVRDLRITLERPVAAGRCEPEI